MVTIMNSVSYQRAKEGKSRLEYLLKERKELSGIGIYPISDDNFGVKVNLVEPIPEGIDIQAMIPEIPVIVRVVGKITFLGV